MKSFIPSIIFACILSRSVLAGFEEGVAAYQANNLQQAFEEFRESAEQGHVDSQFNLGLTYEHGIGIKKDEQEAIVWYRKAAEQGNSNAQFNLAVLYENGRGSAVDFAQANQWYRKAAAQGDALAIGNLGMLYLRGQGVQQDIVAGLALLLQSATMDNSPENRARQNVAMIKGLTAKMIAEAQTLMAEMGDAGNILVPLDQYLKK
jgi:TPR repeat protein